MLKLLRVSDEIVAFSLSNFRILCNFPYWASLSRVLVPLRSNRSAMLVRNDNSHSLDRPDSKRSMMRRCMSSVLWSENGMQSIIYLRLTRAAMLPDVKMAASKKSISRNFRPSNVDDVPETALDTQGGLQPFDAGAKY